jgi:integrase
MLRAALQWAKRERWITDLPYIPIPAPAPPRDRWLTREEADRLLAAAGSLHVQTFLAICLYTGARSGAARELTWQSVDFVAGRIDFGQVAGGRCHKHRAACHDDQREGGFLVKLTRKPGKSCPVNGV